MCSGGVGFLESTFAHCEHTLRTTMDELAWVGMRHTGNRLVVEVMERTPEPEMQNTRKPSNIIASQDGQIVSVSIYRGQLMKIVGDPVQKGTCWSAVFTQMKPDTLESNTLWAASSGGTNKQKKFTCTYEQTLRRPTGETTAHQYLDLFTWHIPLGSTEPPFDDCIRTSGYHWFSCSGKNFPSAYTRKHFTNTAPVLLF